MCAIIDACVLSEVFSKRRDRPTTEAGREFFQWLQDGNGRLVIGGKLTKELLKVSKFSKWVTEAKRNKGKDKNNDKDKLVIIDSNRINSVTKEIEERHVLRSNDSHIIALAQVSGARLLFSKDKKLIRDFENPDIINNPPGKIYSDATEGKRELLKSHRCRLGN